MKWVWHQGWGGHDAADAVAIGGNSIWVAGTTDRRGLLDGVAQRDWYAASVDRKVGNLISLVTIGQPGVNWPRGMALTEEGLLVAGSTSADGMAGSALTGWLGLLDRNGLRRVVAELPGVVPLRLSADGNWLVGARSTQRTYSPVVFRRWEGRIGEIRIRGLSGYRQAIAHGVAPRGNSVVIVGSVTADAESHFPDRLGWSAIIPEPPGGTATLAQARTLGTVGFVTARSRHRGLTSERRPAETLRSVDGAVPRGQHNRGSTDLDSIA
jgi:hypothetical protein